MTNSKAFKRFRRNGLAILGVSLLSFYVVVAILAPVITAPLIAERYRGHRCARDLTQPIDSANWSWYLSLDKHQYRLTSKHLPHIQTAEFALPRGQAGAAFLRNPHKAIFWRAMLIPPRSCLSVPRESFSPTPQPPSRKHTMGIVAGYDIFYGVIWGTRMAFYVGVLVSIISFSIGMLIGGMAGFFGSWLDNLLMRLTDIIYAFPNLILAIVFVTIFGPSLIIALTALALVSWPTYARLFRGDILRIKQLEFVDSAKALGAQRSHIFLKHILPNSITSLIVIASLDIGSVVLLGSTLAFLGLGAEIGTADWGQMISFARDYLQGKPNQPFAYWYISFWPGLFIGLFVLAWNLLGDAYRDVFDPRSQ